MLMRVLAFVPIVALAATGCCKIPGLSKEKSTEQQPTTTTSASGEKTLVMNHECSNDPDLRITKIVRTPTETRVHIQFKNSKRQATDISTALPGSPESFFIEAADQKRRLELRTATGLALSPAKTTVQPGGIVNFVVFFPAIDDTWGPVDIHEGEVIKKGTTYWNFHEVRIK